LSSNEHEPGRHADECEGDRRRVNAVPRDLFQRVDQAEQCDQRHGGADQIEPGRIAAALFG
jgi:hypothetical protein